MKEPASDTRPNWSHVTSQNTYQQQFAKQEQENKRGVRFPAGVCSWKLQIKSRNKEKLNQEKKKVKRHQRKVTRLRTKGNTSVDKRLRQDVIKSEKSVEQIMQ